MHFGYYNISFHRYGSGNLAYVAGEVTNESFKGYETAVFRMVLFNQNNRVVWSGAFKIRGLGAKRTRSFNVTLEGVDFSIIPKISRYDIFFESGY